jgi:choline-sulfatase
MPPTARKRAERRGSREARLSRARLVIVLVGAAAAGLAAAWFGLLRPLGGERPFDGPIVVVSIDTLRADHVSAYGRARRPTPAIDRVAADGVLFERAYSNAPQTLPAHVSILTGQLPPRHGVRDNVGFAVRPGEPTLPGMLRSRGYRSAAFVSAYVLRPETGIGRQFDEYDASFPPSIEASMGSLRRDGAETVTAADAWLSRQRDGRFLLFVHLYEPHRPWRMPPPFSETGGYEGAVGYADAVVGGLMDRLRARHLYDSALVILLSDHGEGLGDHGEEEHGVLLYDEAVHVPLVVKLPGQRRAGSRIGTPVQHVDIVPTVLDIAGVRAPGVFDGVSLRGILDGTVRTIPDRGIYAEALYAYYHFGWSELRSITDSRFRYIQAPTPELYDLRDDPHERRNTASLRPASASAMDGAVRRVAGGRLEQPSLVTGEELERLQALGYVESAPARSDAGSLTDPKQEIRWLERYRDGIRLASERRYADASAAFREVLARHPEMVDVWTQLGHTELRAGRYPQSIEALERAVALKPSVTATVLALAGAELRVGALDRAAAHARLALERDPAGAHEVLARVALAKGRVDEALEEARESERTGAGLPLPAFIQGMILCNAGQYDRAIPLLQQAAARLAPRRLALRDLHQALGDALAQVGRYAEAEAAFTRELESFPENSRTRASLALVYAAEGRRAEAERALTALVATTPTPASYELAARTLAIVGDASAAAEMAEEGLRAFPGHAGLRRLARVGPS